MSTDVVPVTIVYLEEDGDNTLPNWYIQVENSGQSFKFVGQNAAEQEDSIKEFVGTLQDNDVDFLIQAIDENIILPPGMDADQLVDILFDNTNCMYVGDILSYVVPDVPDAIPALVDFLGPLGEALEATLELIGFVFV